MSKKISLLEVKKALKDSRFRMSLPKEFESDVESFLEKPGCGCHVPFYKKILKECKQQLQNYYPNLEIVDQNDLEKLAENNWTVINCHINELESKLNTLPPGRKQMDIARYEDQVTVVVNELDIIF